MRRLASLRPFLVLLCVFVPAAAAASSDSWVTYATKGLPASAIWDGSVAADSAGDRIFLFPRTTNELYVLNLSSPNPEFQFVATSGAAPSPRAGAALLLDRKRNRLLLLGGQESVHPSEATQVWELSLGNPPRWRLLAPGGDAPRARNGILAVYDAVHDRVLMYGGRDNASGDPVSETWVLDLSTVTWNPLETAGAAPPSLSQAGGGFDIVRNRLIVFGGFNPSRTRELWSLSLAGTPTWSLGSASGSPPVTPLNNSMAWSAYDQPGDAIYFECELGFFRLRLAGSGTWEKIDSTASTPSFDPRGGGATLAIDARRNRLLRIGGSRPPAAQNVPITDEALTFQLDLATDQWSELYAAGSFPPPKTVSGFATASYDTKRRLIELPPEGSRAWELDLSSHEWRVRPVSPPTALSGSAVALYDSVGDRTLIFDSGSDSIRVWTMSAGPVASMAPLAFSNAAPPPRTNAAWVLDPSRNRVLMFGGGATNELWSLSVDVSPTWKLLSQTGPAPRQLAMMGVDPVRNRLYLVGGWKTLGSFPQPANDAWSWPLDTDGGWVSEPALTLPVSPTGSTPIAHELQLDGRRTRFLVPVNRYLDVVELSLLLDPTPHWDVPLVNPALLVGVGQLQTVQAIGPTFLDSSVDRFLLPADHFAIDLGTVPFAPTLDCPSNQNVVPGSIASLPWAVVDTAGVPDSVTFEMRCSRDWPGFPIRGPLSKGHSGFAPRYPDLGIPVPDSAAVGPVSFAFTTTGVGVPGFDSSCEAVMDVVGSPIYAGRARAAPDHVWLEWQSSMSGLSLDIQRRAGLDVWESIAARTSATGPLQFEDGSVQAGKHYDYRVVVLDPQWHGEFGLVPVEVPDLALSFAPDQPNPILGHLAVSFYVTPKSDAQVETFDARGRRVGSVRVPAGAGGRVRVDVAAGTSLPSGVFFLRLRQAEAAVVRSFVFLR